jgi:hypothetical protein
MASIKFHVHSLNGPFMAENKPKAKKDSRPAKSASANAVYLLKLNCHTPILLETSVGQRLTLDVRKISCRS